MKPTVYSPARYEMVVDPKTMTISVGQRVFNEPDLARRQEWDFDFKGEICGYPDFHRDTKKWHKFYAEMLGCRFNFRFFAANYWLWLGDRMEQRTANMFKYEGKHWRHYNTKLVQRAHAVLPYLNEAERDGLHQLIPIIVARGASPQVVRAEIGRGAWRRLANNSVTRNVLIMNALARATEQFDAAALIKLLEIPSGVMRAIHSVSDDEIAAARITPKRQIETFMQTLHLVRDTREMMLSEFNPRWSFARMRQKHEAATKAIMQRRFSNKKFAPDWTIEENGYIATLLNSQAEIATEGSVQHHCVASYARHAAAGRYAVFRIDGKERATAGVSGAHIDQVYGACNAAVSEGCRAFAQKVAAKYAAEAASKAA